jgi:hypothetical protein
MRKSILLGLAFLAALTAGSAAAKDGDIFYLTDFLNIKTFYSAWDNLLSQTPGIPKWLAEAPRNNPGTQLPGNKFPPEQTGPNYPQYIGFGLCKPHACGPNQFFVLFKSDGSEAWGYAIDDENPKGKFFNQPDKPKQKMLIELGKN